MILRSLFGIAILVCLLACSNEVPVLNGSTMGTTYSVIVPRLRTSDQKHLQARVEAVLNQVISAMSTYQADSFISRFNASDSTDWFTVPVEFATVANTALEIASASDGAFDPTIAPLVSRWGFGKDAGSELPEADEIALLLEQVGFDYLKVDTNKLAIKKTMSDLQLDLNAIAKGYAVDLLANEVEVLGYKNYLVEIGGELRLRGSNIKGEPWRIGIEQPELSGDVNSGLRLSSAGVATSGDYRNAFESDGIRYSHIIDPRDGYPVNHALASVTVVAETTMLADAWATALMVLGPDDGMKMADEMALASFFILRQESGQFVSRQSTEFTKLDLH